MSNAEIGREQEYVSMLYGRLDGLRERTSERLTRVLRETGGTPQARSERDTAAAMHAERLAQFNAAENGLCFGRLDFQEGETRYIGRLGIFNESGDYEPLLMDWRAPAARPFYLATAASPEGVKRRRHIKTHLREVTGVDDEVLDLTVVDPAHHSGLTSEAALLAALGADRTGRMSDIVETIQAEQDRVIRSSQKGTLVVQGGPGTGKTAVALHRAAYLLYTHRSQLSTRGVLIVGPNPTFLRYIGEVLPSLGETGVLLATVGELFPGVRAERTEPPEVAALKGRAAMADLVAAAVRDRQEVPEGHLEVLFDREVVRLNRRTCTAARDRARRSRRPHNAAREVFAREIVAALTRQVADRLGADVLGGDNLLDETEIDDIREEVRQDTAVQAAIERLWPVLTPQRLLADLFASAERLASAAPWLSAAEREMLRRESVGGWTPADVPLLDEAAELLGENDQAARALAERQRRARVAFAQEVLDITEGSRSIDLEDEVDPEILMAYDLLDAERLAERHEEEEYRTVAQRAAADRTWTFGHVIVDEAQELSEMAWRLLMRRCPSRSMTLAGDLAQTGDLAGTTSWQQVLGPYLQDRWRLEQLTVNYRTPAEIMAVAADVLAELDPTLSPPRSVRETGIAPWRQRVEPADLPEALAAVVGREAAETGDGRLAVLVPASRLDELARAIVAAVPDTTVGDDPDLERRVVVLSVRQAKGLEFDSVLVVDPDRIVAESPRGRGDLYVALTRATRRLGVMHTGELPAALRKLAPQPHAVPSR